MVEQFQDMRWVLIPVGVAKLAGALVPHWLHRAGWPGRKVWRPLCWLGSAGLILWGGVNTLIAHLVLAGLVAPGEEFDRLGMLGHAWLWDPLFLGWGVALAAGLWLSRDRG